MSEAQTMFDAECRAERIIWLPGIGSEDSYSEVFAEEFIDSLPERDDAPLYAALPQLARFREDDDVVADDVAWALHGRPGFLVQAATPVRRFHSGGSYDYSWGHYRTEWLYAASEAEIATVCVAWARKVENAQRASAGLPIVAESGEAA